MSDWPDRDFLAALPKAELHLHVEGTVRPETWLRVLQRHEPATTLTVDDLREQMRFETMAGFFDAWMSILRSLREPEDYRFIAYEAGMGLKAHNVRYVEFHTSAAGAEWSGRMNADEMVAAVAEGLTRAQRDGGPEWRLIVDVIRDLAADNAAEIGLNIALRNRRHGVVALGLGGAEAIYGSEGAREVFAAGRAAGFHLTAHAGEAAGPESIWEALSIGAERIGHAARATEDPALVEHLARERIPLEMCPTSNVRTGAVSSLAAHPIAHFLRRGMPVSLNTDDPPLFGTDLTTEYIRMAETFNLTRKETVRLARNAFETAFLPELDRTRLMQG